MTSKQKVRSNDEKLKLPLETHTHKNEGRSSPQFFQTPLKVKFKLGSRKTHTHTFCGQMTTLTNTSCAQMTINLAPVKCVLIPAVK